jgi:hypothetical protein
MVPSSFLELWEVAEKVRSQVEYSIRRLKPLLILLGFCGATGSRALSKPPRIEFSAAS